MKLIDRYSKPKKGLILVFFLSLSNVTYGYTTIASFYGNSIERSFVMQYMLFNYYNFKKWMASGHNNMPRNSSPRGTFPVSFSYLFKKPMWMQTIYNTSTRKPAVQDYVSIESLPGTQQGMNELNLLSRAFSKQISFLIKNTIKERREYLNATQWMQRSSPFWLQYVKPYKSEGIALGQWEGCAEGVESDNTIGLSSNISSKISLLLERLQECKEVLSGAEQEKIEPIGEDELYRNAKGSLVETLRSRIKKVKKEFNISDESLLDGYSRNLGGGDYYIVVGKNSNGFFKGFRDERDDDLQTYVNAQIKGIQHYYQDVYHRLQGNMKIHLQPASGSQLLFLVEKLIALGHENTEFRDSLAFFKVYTDVNFNYPKDEIIQQLKEHSGDGIVPQIVLYPATGKDRAQRVLNIIYEALGSLKGLDCAPSYNEKVTSLIYFTQHNRDIKEAFKEYFNGPRVYFNELLEVPSYKHRLKNPRLDLLLQKYKDAVEHHYSLDRIIHLIEKIQRKNFSLQCADDEGYSLLDYAYLFCNQDVVAMLRKQNAHCSALTPRTCIEMHNFKALPLVLQHYSDMNSLEDDNSLYYYALKSANAEAFDLLYKCGLKINAFNKNRRTPLGQFIYDINGGVIIFNENHAKALEQFLHLWPSLGSVKAHSDTSELFNRLKRYERDYKEHQVMECEMRLWEIVDLNSN